MEFELGHTYSGYKILDIVGRSRSEVQYRVQNTLAHRVEGLRTLTGAAVEDPDAAERFLREVRIRARLSHPNILAFYTAVPIEGRMAMTAELPDESFSLADRLLAGALAWREALDITRQLLDALNCLHRQSFVHCDVTPENILLVDGGFCKLADFSQARPMDLAHDAESGAVVGNPRYISPEQVKGDCAIDQRSDLYSLGVVLYEMLCGRPPFESRSQFELMMAHVHQEPAAPSGLNPKVPLSLDAVVLKALAKAREDRYQSAAEFAAAIPGRATGEATAVASAPEAVPVAKAEPEALAVVALEPSAVTEPDVVPEPAVVVAEPEPVAVAETIEATVAEPEPVAVAEPEVVATVVGQEIVAPEHLIAVAEPEVVPEPAVVAFAEPQVVAVAESEVTAVAEPDRIGAAEPEVVPEPEIVAVAEPEFISIAEPEAVAIVEPEIAAITGTELVPEPAVVAFAEPQIIAAAESEVTAVALPEPIAAAESVLVVLSEPEPVAVADPEVVAAAIVEPEVAAVAEPQPIANPGPEPEVVAVTVAVTVPEAVAVAEPHPVLCPPLSDSHSDVMHSVVDARESVAEVAAAAEAPFSTPGTELQITLWAAAAIVSASASANVVAPSPVSPERLPTAPLPETSEPEPRFAPAPEPERVVAPMPAFMTTLRNAPGPTQWAVFGGTAAFLGVIWAVIWFAVGK